MKRASLAVFILWLIVPLTAEASEIDRGRVIYESIVHDYPGLTLYLKSGMMGENATLVADVPRPRWKKMASADRRALAAYVRSELSIVRSSPSRYSLTPTTAPIWPTHRDAFERICGTCWEIDTGPYDRTTRSLGDDPAVAMKGAIPHESAQPRVMLHETGLKPLSADEARKGEKLYNAAGVHEATIVAVDIAADRITVRYVSSGAVEPKMLSAVGALWYVKR